MAMFGGLLSVCVRDDRLRERGLFVEGVFLMVLGAASSVLTAYALAAAGLLL